jgi:hypothetical protein
MKNILLSGFFFLVSSTTFANFPVHPVTIDKQIVKANFKSSPNIINWSLNANGDIFEIQNSAPSSMLVEIYANPITNNKISDPIAMYCNNSQSTISPGISTLCQIPYTNVLALGSIKFANGASGQYSIIGQDSTASVTWNLSSPGTVTLLNNASAIPINVLYYEDYYYNQTASLSSQVLVSCTNKQFEITHGNARICQIPAGGSAQVQLLAEYGNTASGGFMIFP